MGYLLRNTIIANFVLKFAIFRFHGNKGRSENSLADTIKFGQPSKPPVGCKYLGYISHASWVIDDLVLKFANFRYYGNRGRS